MRKKPWKPIKVLRGVHSDPKKLSKRKKIALAVFLAVTLVLLIFIVFGIITVVNDVMKDPPEVDASSTSASQKQEFSEQDSLYYVVIRVSDEDKTAASAFSLVKYSPVRKGVAIATFPAETKVEGGTLASIYAYGGEDAVIEEFTDMTGGRLDGHVLFNDYAIRMITDIFTSITVNVPEDMLSDSGNISYAKGNRKLIGNQVLEVLNYSKWKNGNSDKLMMFSKFHAALINENLSGGTAGHYSDIYNRIYNTIGGETSISSITFERVKDGMAYLGSLNPNANAICKIIEVHGEVDPQTNEFSVNSDVLGEIKDSFGTV